jgi:hypothetical protein
MSDTPNADKLHEDINIEMKATCQELSFKIYKTLLAYSTHLKTTVLIAIIFEILEELPEKTRNETYEKFEILKKRRENGDYNEKN